MALAGSFSGSSAQVAANTAALTPVATNVNIETQVESYFSDIPVMVDIARCESHMRHYDTYGNTIRGEIDPRDVGVMQINEHYHANS